MNHLETRLEASTPLVWVGLNIPGDANERVDELRPMFDPQPLSFMSSSSSSRAEIRLKTRLTI
jgi:hypothetical protein